MRGPTFKIVDDSERVIRYPKKVYSPSRWDKVASLVNADKTVFVATKHRPSITAALANRGIKKLRIFARDGGFIVFKKEENEDFAVDHSISYKDSI